MKAIIKKVLIYLIVLVLLLQFYPRHNDNISIVSHPQDIAVIHHLPDSIQNMLKVSCYDCHSDNTNYPWYAKIQPVSMWLRGHINDGKEDLNFSEFGNYSLRGQYHKLQETRELVEAEKMPLKSYLIIHKDARLTPQKKMVILNWVNSLIDSFQKNYPPDSLQKKNSQKRN